MAPALIEAADAADFHARTHTNAPCVERYYTPAGETDEISPGPPGVEFRSG
jgi:hypothetical protein